MTSNAETDAEPRTHGFWWLPRSEVIFGVVLGLLVSAVLVGLMPQVRHHMFGGTDLRETTVLTTVVTPMSEDSDRMVVSYQLGWRDENDQMHVAEFKRTGEMEHQTGETWTLWVSEEQPQASSDTSPLVTWLWLGLGIPLISLFLGLLIRWRHRVYVRAALQNTPPQ